MSYKIQAEVLSGPSSSSAVIALRVTELQPPRVTVPGRVYEGH